MATRGGIVKKCNLADFSRPRSSGLRAIVLTEDDELVGVGLTEGNSDLLLFSDSGKSIRFSETDVRVMGRGARGVRGIALKKGQRLIAMLAVRESDTSKAVLTATARGYGKQTSLTEFPRKRRGGQGVIAIQDGIRNGKVGGAVLVSAEDELKLMTESGRLVRTRVAEIPRLGRNTQGVRLIDMAEQESLISVGLIEDAESHLEEDSE